MMQLVENQSKIWFKILTDKGEPIDGSRERWSLPFGQEKGNKLNFQEQKARYRDESDWLELPYITGTWLISDPKTLYPSDNHYRIFVVELLAAPHYEVSGIVWVNRVRLIREATNLDLKRYGIYRAFALCNY